MSDDLIKRNIVIATIGRMYEVCTTRDITDYRDLMLEAVKVLPSADRPTVIRVKSLMGKEDYERLADSIRQQAPTAIVIPPYAELVTPADRPQGWIPCSERLPSEFSDDERVLATAEVDGLGVILMPSYDVKSWYLKGYITAWMPSPEPWKGADDE